MVEVVREKIEQKTSKSPTHPKYVSYDNLDKTAEAALFYGFTPLSHVHINPSDISNTKSISEGEIVVDHDNHEEGASVRLEEKVALLRLYDKEKMGSLPQPLMFYYKKPFIGDKRKAGTKESHHGIEIIGTSKSIAEALLVQTAYATLLDSGETDLHVEINSIGDKESLSRFTKEITAYYKKHMSELPTDCRQTFKKDVFSLLGCDHDACKKLAKDCPNSINFLSEKSRQHFKETLEYLETLEIPYVINNTLVANRDYCSEVIFEIRDSNPQSHPKAIGIRYDTLAKKLGHKKELPAAGVCFAIDRTLAKKSGMSEPLKQPTIAKILKPEICFMQLGFEAKIQSLKLTEVLRQSRIPVIQSLAKDKMAGQVGIAEKSHAPVVMIMGKKEAVEGTVIVRDAATRSQDTVRLEDVASRLKKYKI